MYVGGLPGVLAESRLSFYESRRFTKSTKIIR